MEKPKRKRNRIVDFAYDTPGAYYITVCTEGKKCLLSRIVESVGEVIGLPYEQQLTVVGKIVDEGIANISKIYPTVDVDHYVIMPNHVHLILVIQESEGGRPMASPTVSRIINQFKGYVSKRVGNSIWQKSFHDHVIRDVRDYEEIVKYIYENPIHWALDELYIT